MKIGQGIRAGKKQMLETLGITFLGKWSFITLTFDSIFFFFLQKCCPEAHNGGSPPVKCSKAGPEIKLAESPFCVNFKESVWVLTPTHTHAHAQNNSIELFWNLCMTV